MAEAVYEVYTGKKYGESKLEDFIWAKSDKEAKKEAFRLADKENTRVIALLKRISITSKK